MIDDDLIYHIHPTNDLKEHLLKTRQNSLGIFCDCECEPRIDCEGGRYFVVHNSHDGREGLEQAREILQIP